MLWGPISDRYGRRRPLMIGSTGAVIAAATAVAAPTIESLVVARFFQAVAAFSGIVVALAIITDKTVGFASTRAVTSMMMIQSCAPVAAPVAGGALAAHFSWRVVLAVVFGLSVLQILGVITAVGESLPADRRSSTIGYGQMLRLMGRPRFIGFALTKAFTISTLLSFLANSSFAYHAVIGGSSLLHGIGRGINALGLVGVEGSCRPGSRGGRSCRR